MFPIRLSSMRLFLWPRNLGQPTVTSSSTVYWTRRRSHTVRWKCKRPMALNEFELIEKYFHHQPHGAGVDLGIGDDCAVLNLAAGKSLAVTVDTLVEGVHFPAGADPELLAQRALRVNLSDVAAMGGEPQWFTLALTLPEPNAAWL